MSSNLKICTHPLVRHKLSALRDKSVAPKEFRELTKEIATLLAYEAMSDLEMKPRTVAGVDGDTQCEEVAPTIALAPVMRSGLGMVEGFIYAFPDAQVWHLGLYRDPKTLVAIEYYNRLTAEARCDVVYILDTTLSCGSTARAAVQLIKDWGVKKIKLVVAVAAPEGIRAFQEEHPDVPIVAGALDPGLNADHEVSPGIGDAGSRLFGTY